MKKKLMLLLGSVAVLPVVASAASTYCASQVSGTLQNILCRIGDFLQAAIPILIVLAVLYFIWGVIQYVVSGDEEKKANGKSMMVYGIIGIAVIVGIWGLVNLLLRSFGVDKVQTTPLPTVLY